MTESEALGHRLAMLRHARRLAQKEVADAAGISQKHLSQLERGHVSVLSLASGKLRNLAEYFGVTTDALIARPAKKRRVMVHEEDLDSEIWDAAEELVGR